MMTNALFASAADGATQASSQAEPSHHAQPSDDAQPSNEAQTSNEGFHPSSGGANVQSGERLLVEAYAAIWLCVLVFVVVMWRRTRALEERIEALDGAVKAARDKPGGKPAKKPAAEPAHEGEG
jgi:hypothetical protein